MIEEEAKVLVGTYARAPVVLSSGKGCKLFDPEGKEYLDCASGIAVNALGHGDPDWLRAVTEQAAVLAHTSNVYYTIPQVLIQQCLCVNDSDKLEKSDVLVCCNLLGFVISGESWKLLLISFDIPL